MHSKTYLSVFLALILGFTGFSQSKNAAAEVKSLPGLDKMVSKIYAGMYNVSRTRGIFYTLIESESDPVNDPLLVYF